MTARKANQIRELSDSANEALRAGRTLDRPRFREFETVLHGVDFAVEDLDHQILILGCVRRFADLADRAGRYEDSRRMLEPHLKNVLKWIDTATSDGQHEAQPKVIVELCWFIIVWSVSLHRDERFAEAKRYVAELDRAITLIPKSDSLELRCRRAYALGRHCQSMAERSESDAAEKQYTDSLRLCMDIAVSNLKDAKEYSTYRTAVVLIGGARLFLDRGELDRAYRQLLVAKTLLAGHPDKVTSSFGDFLFGCIARQQARLDEAKEKLESAMNIFRELRHKRYYLRSRHELAKALLNDGDTTAALATLRPADSDDTASDWLHEPNAPTISRWAANDAVLEARIRFEHEQRAAAATRRQIDTSLLESLRRDIDEQLTSLRIGRVRSTDVRARGLLVQSEIDLALSRPKSIETRLSEITAGRTDPLDAADRAWAWLLIAAGRFALGQTEGALYALAQFDKLPNENRFFRRRAEELKQRVLARENVGLLIDIKSESDIKRWDIYEGELAGYVLEKLEKFGVSHSAQARRLGIGRTKITSLRVACGRPRELDNKDDAGPQEPTKPSASKPKTRSKTSRLG